MKQKDDMRGVRFMVMTMGIVLMGGVLVLVYAGFNKIKTQSKERATNNAVALSEKCESASAISLPNETLSIIHPVTREGNQLMVITQQQNHVEVLIANICDASIMKRIVIK